MKTGMIFWIDLECYIHVLYINKNNFLNGGINNWKGLRKKL